MGLFFFILDKDIIEHDFIIMSLGLDIHPVWQKLKSGHLL